MGKSKPAAMETPGIGHNSGSVSGMRIKSFIERVERCEVEKQAAADDVKDVYTEAKAAGFEPKILRRIVKERKADREKLREEKELLELYLSAMGDPELAEILS